MDPRLSIHQVGFPGSSLARFAAMVEGIGARQMTCIAPALLDEGVQALRAALAGRAVTPVAIAHAFSSAHPLSDRAGWAGARDTLDRLIDTAAELAIPTIYMLTGGRGTLDWEAAADVFAEAVRPCVARARAAGVHLAIENAAGLYADIHIAHSLADTLRLAKLAQVDICVELFFAWPEAGLADLIAQTLSGQGPRCRIVQLSDYVLGDRTLPSRAVPGDGVVPLQSILRTVLDLGYAGPLDLELLGPRIAAEGPEAAYQRAGAHVTGLLAGLAQ